MISSAEFKYDVTSAISLGRRDLQEDAIICDFPLGSPLGFAVLSDGMGGHAAGDIASKIVVTEVFSELKLQSGDPQHLEDDMAEVLLGAATAANECLCAHAESEPDTAGMGATLVAPILMRDRLYWISVGDSPLLMFRDGTLSQLNEDHSMAPQIDLMVRTGQMETETGLNHPDRNCLTSVLSGRSISRVDCPTKPVQLRDGDIVIAASDGLQFLDDATICDLLTRHANDTSAEISNALLHNLDDLDDPDQDNVSFCVIKVGKPAQYAGAEQMVPALTRQLTQVPERAVARPGKKVVTIMASSSKSNLSMMYRVSSGRGA